MIAKISVTLKTGIPDPQGNAVKHSFEVTGYKDVEEVRIGRFIELRLADMPYQEAAQKVREICEKILANTIIENYRFEIEQELESYEDV